MQINNKHCRTTERKFKIQIDAREKLTFEETYSCMYLSAVVNLKCEEECEVNLRLTNSTRCAEVLNNMLKIKIFITEGKTKYSIYDSATTDFIVWKQNMGTEL